MSGNPGHGDRIIRFYEGTAADDRGRRLEEILQFDDARLEATHDWPLEMASASEGELVATFLNARG